MEKLPDQIVDVPDGSEGSTSENLIDSTRLQVADLQKNAAEVQERFLVIIQQRLRRPTHFQRPAVDPAEVRHFLETQPKLLHSLSCMEDSGGQPDIISLAKHCFVFADCSPESPNKRRGLDFLEIVQKAEIYGIKLLTQNIYKRMQTMGKFDENSSSVLETSDELIKQGLALIGFRGNKGASFINIDQSKKSDARGWRGMISVSRVKS